MGQMAEIHWQLRLGDNDALGWTITTLYVLGVILSLRAGLRERQETAGAGRPLLWFAIAVVLLLLGANSQLDLQLLLEEHAVHLYRRRGWTGHRQTVQVVFTVVVLVGLVMGIVALVRQLRGTGKRYWLACLGTGVLGLFVIFRASEFVRPPFLWNLNRLHPDWVKVALEVPGLVLLCMAGWRGATK